MNATGYIINTVLVLLVVRQVREHRLDLRSLARPVALVAVAAAYFLHTIPTGGNDIALEVTLVVTGAVFGTLSGLATHVRRGDDGAALARAGWLAAGLWIFGIGARMGFGFFSDHGAGPAIARFSLAHNITGANAWVAALVLMALADVTARLITLQLRAHKLPAAVDAVPNPTYELV